MPQPNEPVRNSRALRRLLIDAILVVVSFSAGYRYRSSGTETLTPLLAYIPGAVATATATPSLDKVKFEALYHAGKSIQGGLAIGVTFEQFGQRLQSLATEVSIAVDKAATPNERDMVGRYANALQTYADSNILWKAKIACDVSQYCGELRVIDWPYGRSYDEDLASKGMLSSTFVNAYATSITVKEEHEYKRKGKSTVSTITRSVSTSDAKTAMQQMWLIASQHLDDANAIYGGSAPSGISPVSKLEQAQQDCRGADDQAACIAGYGFRWDGMNWVR